jgi:hypothetical protein
MSTPSAAVCYPPKSHCVSHAGKLNMQGHLVARGLAVGLQV